MSTLFKLAHVAASTAASDAATAYVNMHYNGKDQGACGFAWVTVWPVNKGNTRLGKQERRDLESIGFSKDYTGKAWQLWNPSKWGGQNIDTKYIGARAYADKFNEMTGISISAGDRLD